MTIIAAFEVKRSRAGLDQFAQSRRDLMFNSSNLKGVRSSGAKCKIRRTHLPVHCASAGAPKVVGREVYKHLAPLEPEHRFGSRFAAATSMVQPPTNSYCQSASAGIYSVPSLAPLANKVSQVEMEAGDCEGRLPPLFLPDARGQRSEVRCQRSDVRGQMSDVRCRMSDIRC